jgi:hypothetical protein
VRFPSCNVSHLLRVALAIAALATLGWPVSAAPLACHARSAHAKVSEQQVEMRVVNASNVPALITWIDFEGKQKPYFFLQPGKSQVQSTYATHPWIAVSTTNNCMCGHIAEAGAGGADEWVIAPFEPTPSYRTHTLDGFRVNVSSRLVAEAVLLDKSIAHVDRMLRDMAMRLPADAVAALREATPLWFERSDCRSPSGTYHPSHGWLSANGVNPDKTKGVQFTADHLHWSETQPAMMLHEFAHAFHDRFLRFDNPDVLKAFARACRGGKYESVSYARGGKKRAYALNNQMEFFAELSEAYFWRNDFEPFDRDAFAKFDPESMRLIERLWRTPPGVPNTGETGDPLSCDEATKMVEK